jgi:lysophospholipase L1-like esterase
VFWYEFEVRAMEHAFRTGPPPGPTPPVVFYGSSSIRLWTNLAEDLGDPQIVNLGFGGSTLAACVHYFERLVVPRQPGSLVVYAGDNDLGDGRTAVDVIGSFRELIAKVDAFLGPIPFAFLSIKPSLARWSLIEDIRTANETIRADLSRRPRSTYIDIATAMLGDDGRPRGELFLEDGLHLSPEGYRVWADRILADRAAIFSRNLHAGRARYGHEA